MSKAKILRTIAAIIFLTTSCVIQAQTPDAVITSFKAISYFNSGVPADSILYQAENPEIGPTVLDDTLDVFGPKGSFELLYTSEKEPVNVALWVDLNQNDVFEENERIYSGSGNEGMLLDDLVLPELNGPSRALLAISQNADNLADPNKVLQNDRVSSLEFTMNRSTSPKLTMTSKKNTIDPDSTCFETELTFDLISTEDTTYIITAWTLTYPSSATAPVGSAISKTSDGTPFGVGSLLTSATPIVGLKLDFTGLGLVDGMPHTLTCTFAPIWDLALEESADLVFEKCIVSSINNPSASRPDLPISIHPNPIQNQGTITYELTKHTPVQLSIYDLHGRMVQTIYSGNDNPGIHQIGYIPSEDLSGLFLLTLRTADQLVSKKIMIIKP
ncbi:MAG: T9SS type A sorting domain-containing protein [Saprospiraceae bacterium]|nr:T9SS type A sorting domain-containing protein [Lewinella sp.]